MIWRNIEYKHTSVHAVEETLTMIITNIDFLDFKSFFLNRDSLYKALAHPFVQQKHNCLICIIFPLACTHTHSR